MKVVTTALANALMKDVQMRDETTARAHYELIDHDNDVRDEMRADVRD